MQKEVHGGHGASGEEVLRHPLCVGSWFDVKGIGMLSMTEHLQEEETTRFQPGCHSLEKQLIVLHVLEQAVSEETYKAKSYR